MLSHLRPVRAVVKPDILRFAASFHNAALIFIFVGMLMAGCEQVTAQTFDEARAMQHIRTQCAFGPRIPGTEAHARTRDWIKEQIEELGLTVWEQPFEVVLPMSGEKVQAWNIWGLPKSVTGNGTDEPLFVLSAHWDTRPWADKDPGRQAMLGANDGASGVAMALEITRALKDSDLADHVVLGFFDAEDSGISDQGDEFWCLGSRHAAANLPAWFERVKLGVNLDMVAGRDMKLRREDNSMEAAPEAMNRLWRIGLDLAPEIFIDEPLGPMTDDHVPFIEAGIPYIDIIGLPYEHWHRATDTPVQCDPRKMKRLANVLIQFLKREK